MILLDTNILPEMMRPLPATAVERWLGEQPAASLFISAVTEAELRFGLALLPDGKRRSRLTAEVEGMLAEDFADRILPFDSAAAIAFARIASERRKAGQSPRPMPRSPQSRFRAAPFSPRETWPISRTAGSI